MTNRLTRNELDFTEEQLIDCLISAGWSIPDPAVNSVKLVLDGVRFSVRWKTDVVEPAP